MTIQNKALTLSFFSGLEAFHAVIHAYFGLTKTDVKQHPVEMLGMNDTPGFHLLAALANGAIAIGLGVKAWNTIKELQEYLPNSTEQRSQIEPTYVSH